jgi:hypothetical protein
MRKCIEPKKCIACKSNQDQTWDVSKQQTVVSTAGPVLDSLNVSLYLGDMFTLCTTVETAKFLLERFKFRVSVDHFPLENHDDGTHVVLLQVQSEL